MNNIFLDLDETLISAKTLEEIQDNKEVLLKKYYKMDDQYYIFERPYLQEFLTFLFKYFNVSIFTAASKNYALFIIKNIILQDKPERKLDLILWSFHCDKSYKKKKGPKNLQGIVWKNIKEINKTNTLIIDDHPKVKEVQPKNCLTIKEFNILDNNKDEELKYIQELLQIIKNDTNIKKIQKYL